MRHENVSNVFDRKSSRFYWSVFLNVFTAFFNKIFNDQLGELDFEHAVLLNAFGPRCISVADTKSRTFEANVSFYLTSKLISKPLQLSTLIEDQLGLTERLQKSLLLSYSPSVSKVFNVYSNDFLSRSVDSNDSKLNLFYAKPISYPIVKQCELVVGKNFALADALDSLGGLKLLLYMFARVKIFVSE